MNKSYILFLGYLFLFTTSYAQFKTELNKVYSGTLVIKNNTKVKVLASNLTFNSKKLITQLDNEFGYINKESKENIGITHIWENVDLKKIKTKNCTIIINESFYNEEAENINGKITYIKIPTIDIYILDHQKNYILESKIKERKMKKFFKKLINKASKTN